MRMCRCIKTLIVLAMITILSGKLLEATKLEAKEVTLPIPKIKARLLKDENGIQLTIKKTKNADDYAVFVSFEPDDKLYKSGQNYYSNSLGYTERQIMTVGKSGAEKRSITLNASDIVRRCTTLPAGTYTIRVQSINYNIFSTQTNSEFSAAKKIKVKSKQTNPGFSTEYDFSKIKKGSIIKFGAYEQDGNFKNGNEPIEWIVLKKTKSQLFVVSKYVLDCIYYNQSEDNSWENCSLRKWLNKKFYNAAFNEIEKGMIKTTKVENYDNPIYGTSGGNDTKDKIFILSQLEIIDPEYGFSEIYSDFDINRRCSPTMYAYARGSNRSYKNLTADGEETCDWALRSPGMDTYCIAGVDSNGAVVTSGAPVYYALPIRPALVISLDTINSKDENSKKEIQDQIKNDTKYINDKADKAYMKQLKKICKKCMEEAGKSSILFDYVFKDINGDGIHEAVFVYYRLGMYIYSYEDGKIKDLFPYWGDIIDELDFYPETNSLIHVRSLHGGERHDYYKMNKGVYMIVASKVRRLDEGSPWVFYNEDEEEITKSEFKNLTKKLLNGKKIIVTSDDFVTYKYEAY